MILQAWWGIKLYGSTQFAYGAPVGFSSGASGDPSLTVVGSVAANPVLRVTGYTSQTGPLAQFTDNDESTVRAEITKDGYYKVGSDIVLRGRKTGWTSDPTGTLTRTTFATSSVTLTELAERVAALIVDLRAHGLVEA
jgi:hypothetical protein